MAKTQDRHFNVLIIGQGLAGSLLAWEMIQQGLSVMVIDNSHHNSSSTVAAGIINPITGHRINLTHGFANYLDDAKTAYQQLENTFEKEFLVEIAQQRLIKNPGQQNYYFKRLEQDDYKNYITPLTEVKGDAQTTAALSSSQYGIGNIQQTYRVNASDLLDTLKLWLQEQGSLLIGELNYADIEFSTDQVNIHSNDYCFSADNIIFCEGYQAIHNPWLKGLPFKLAKGEILTLELDQPCSTMLNWGQWLTPTSSSNRTVFLGANYAWNDTSSDTSENIAVDLLASMKKHTTASGKVIAHKAGIRPSTINRQAIIGKHPSQARLYCFNGFGSKGCLTIPHYAKQFTQHFSKNEPLSSVLPNIETTLSFASDNLASE